MIKTDLKALDQVLSRFEQLNQPWIPRRDWLQCQLALAEGFTNAVRHAHKNLPFETPIEIDLKLNQHSLEIRIIDCGPPFDLDGFLQSAKNQEDQMADHGRGLPILQKIAAHLSYSRLDDHHNCLLIIKNFYES
ncbi:putative anti-sigma regulatory factor, serine/threonine protein kinase [Rippkaea orientalis PCC 8801]|uniref:Putative anti-sigma regulatory factor, serine/threonine protein kinase n=1 Tax=Rippkaea orientalis (strain PCC 8801 / RF-1) TaxID=41431 RepID=B7JXS4_RIPO1|nr:ATP-binding protein [Rippkaea orientalis]ACK65888.1 putative anti-sigma regulatory factor, serine/threonine protein kinase [Rippkaea orientalis PCC 8801]